MYHSSILISAAGDYGFDPLSLAREPAKLEKFVEFEILHAR